MSLQLKRLQKIVDALPNVGIMTTHDDEGQLLALVRTDVAEGHSKMWPYYREVRVRDGDWGEAAERLSTALTIDGSIPEAMAAPVPPHLDR